MANFLDDNGLLYVWQKMKQLFAKQTDLDTTNTNLASLQSDVDGLESLVGASSVANQINAAIDGLDSNITAESNKAIASVIITNGKISGSTKVAIPTNNNQLTNGAGYQTASDVDSAIQAALSEKESFQIEVVDQLPASGDSNTIYLVPSGSGSTNYVKYIYYNSQWVNIGTTSVDLSGYWAKADLVAITNSQIDTIVNTVFAS